ncbi:MAG: hypothetical protein NTV44_06070, partial [Firmicutes bacterium]|nr:hypothetical protein [Bacillota bacterium]
MMGGIIYGNIPIPYNKNATDFEGFVIDSKDNYFIYESRLTKYYIYEKNNTRETGDFLEIKGAISTYHFPV